MDFASWFAIGREHGYCSLPICNTHDAVPISEQEEMEWEDGGDPCAYVVRLYESIEQMNDVETHLDKWN